MPSIEERAAEVNEQSQATACLTSGPEPAKQTKQEVEEEFEDHEEEGLAKNILEEPKEDRQGEEEENEEEPEDPEVHKASEGKPRQREAVEDADEEVAGSLAELQGKEAKLRAEAPETAVEVAPECVPEAFRDGP